MGPLLPSLSWAVICAQSLCGGNGLKSGKQWIPKADFPFPDHFVLIEKYQFSLYPVFAGGVGRARATDQFAKGDWQDLFPCFFYEVKVTFKCKTSVSSEGKKSSNKVTVMYLQTVNRLQL